MSAKPLSDKEGMAFWADVIAQVRARTHDLGIMEKRKGRKVSRMRCGVAGEGGGTNS